MQQGFHIRCYDYYTAPDSGTFVDCCALYLTLYVCLMCNALEENSLHTHYCLVQAHSVICLVHRSTVHEVIIIPVYTLIFVTWNFCRSCIYGCPCFATVHMYHCTHVPQYTCTTVHMYHSTHVPQYTCTTVHKYHSTQVPQYTCTTVHMYHSTQVPQYTCTTVHMYHSTHVPQYTCTTVHMYVPLYTCTTVHMCHSTHVPQYTCATVHMYHCTHVRYRTKKSLREVK